MFRRRKVRRDRLQLSVCVVTDTPKPEETAQQKYFGPDRKELWFWLVFAGAVLCFTAFAVWYRGFSAAPEAVDAIGGGILVFGYLFGRSVNRLFVNPPAFEEDA